MQFVNSANGTPPCCRLPGLGSLDWDGLIGILTPVPILARIILAKSMMSMYVHMIVPRRGRFWSRPKLHSIGKLVVLPGMTPWELHRRPVSRTAEAGHRRCLDDTKVRLGAHLFGRLDHVAAEGSREDSSAFARRRTS